MKKLEALALLAALALAAPSASAQVEERDHRDGDKVEKRDHRKDKKRVERRDHRDGDDVKKRDHRDEKVDAVKGRKPRPVKPRAVEVKGFAPKGGKAGTSVTIRGTGFNRDTKVVFGGTVVENAKLTRSAITFSVPAGAGGKQQITLRHGGGETPVGTFNVASAGGPAADKPLKVAPGRDVAVAAPVGDRVAVAPEEVPSRRGGRGHAWGHLPVVSSFFPAVGGVDTKVTVRGRRFDDQIQVLVGDLPAAAVTIEPNAIKFRVPKGATDGMIVLRHPDVNRDIAVGQIDLNAKAPKRDPDRRKRAKERRERAEERWKQRRAKLAADRAERMQALKERQEQLARTRAERRAKRLEELRARWEVEFLADPVVQAELALHAERLARIRRALRIATAADRGELVVRLEIVTERENDRHDRRMQLLQQTFKP